MVPVLVVRGRKKKGSVYDSFTFAAFPQWCKQQKRRWGEEGEREREGGGCCSEKNDAAAVLGGCRLGRDGEGERMERRAGEGGLTQSAVSDVGFTAPNPSGALLPVHHRPQYSKVSTGE